jgi:hypothetical protein
MELWLGMLMFGVINKLVVGVDVAFEHGDLLLAFFAHLYFSNFKFYYILIVMEEKK